MADQRFIEDVGFQLAERGVSFSEESVELRSGTESSWYFDAKRALCSSFMMENVGVIMVDKAKEKGLDYSHLCAMGIGGYALMFSMVLTEPENTRWTQVYKGADNDPDNGLGGASVEGQDVLLVDDVFTSGSSLAETAEIVVAEGGRVKDAMVLVSRGGEETEQAFRQKMGVEIVPIYRFQKSSGMLVPA